MNLFSRKKRLSSSYGQSTVARLDRHRGVRFLLEHLLNANLQKPGITKESARDSAFSSNEDFWKAVLHSPQQALRWVKLMRFQLVDWFPRTPGLYHTEDAALAREEANRYLHEENGIWFYDPRGKSHMIDGGIGSVRFKPIPIRDDEYWLCTATSDGYCHSGVPLAIPTGLIEQVDFKSAHLYKITGEVKFLPEFLEKHFYHMRGVPQIYVLVDSIERASKERGAEVEISPMVFFKARITESSTFRGRSNGDNNVTYVRCHANTLSDLNAAAEWLVQYADRYGGEIITNFDQQRPTFQDAPFSLQKVMTGRLKENDLERLHIDHAEIICDTVERIHTEAITMTKIDVKLGDGTVIHGDFVIANSIKNSFNKVASADIADDLKELLQKLTKEVGVMSEALPEDTSQQVARDLETLTTEATSKAPRKRWWELSLDGIKQAAISVGEIGKPVLEIVTLLIPLLTTKSS